MLKIDDLSHIARVTNAAVIRISESKLGDSVLCCDRNRQRGGMACYIGNYLIYNVKLYFSKDKENTFFESLLPNTKPIVVGTIYCPPNQPNLWRFLMTICLK